MLLHRAFELRFKHLPCEAQRSRGVEMEPRDVRQSLTGVILPSSGDCTRRYKRTHLHFGFGGGRGHLVLLLGLQDLLHEATCSSSRGEHQKSIPDIKKNQICKLKGRGNMQILRHCDYVLSQIQLNHLKMYI